MLLIFLIKRLVYAYRVAGALLECSDNSPLPSKDLDPEILRTTPIPS